MANRAAGHPSLEQMLQGSVAPTDILRRCGRTFHAASLVLPTKTRYELAVLYAFCRLVDDCGDFADATSSGYRHAHALLDEIEWSLGSPSTASPLVAAFNCLARERGVPMRHARHLIDGVRSDLGPVRVQTEDELLRYAFRVASTVGLMMCRVLGVPTAGDPFAIDLGIAMQLTNIARDVREDADANRAYLPSTWVDHAIVLRPPRLRSSGENTQVMQAVERLLTLADRYYRSADTGMRYLPRTIRPGIRAAAANYRAIGIVIRRAPRRALVSRAYTTGVSKVARTAAAACAALLDEAPNRLPQLHDHALHAAVAPLWRPVATS